MNSSAAASKRKQAQAPETIAEGTLCTGADGWFIHKERRDLNIGGVSFQAVMGTSIVNKDKTGAFLATRTPEAVTRIKVVTAKDADNLMQECFAILAKPGRAPGKMYQASDRRRFAERTVVPTGCADPLVYAERLAEISAALRNIANGEAPIDMQNRFDSAAWAFGHLMNAVYGEDAKDIHANLTEILKWKTEDGPSIQVRINKLFPHKLKNVIIGKDPSEYVKAPAFVEDSALASADPVEERKEPAEFAGISAAHNIFLPDKFRVQVKELMAKRQPLPEDVELALKKLQGTERYVHVALRLMETSYAKLTDTLNGLDKNLNLSEMKLREIAADAHVLTQHSIRIRGNKPLSAADMGVIRDAISDPMILSNLNAAAGKLQPSYFFAYASRLVDPKILIPLAQKAGVDIAQFPLLYRAASDWMERYRNAPAPYIPKKPLQNAAILAARFMPLPAPKPAVTPKPAIEPKPSAALAPKPVAVVVPAVAQNVAVSDGFKKAVAPHHDDKAPDLEIILFPGFELHIDTRKQHPASVVTGKQSRKLSDYDLRIMRVLSSPKHWGKVASRNDILAEIGGNRSRLSTESYYIKRILDQIRPGLIQISYAGIQLGSSLMPLPTNKNTGEAFSTKPVNTESAAPAPAEPNAPSNNPFEPTASMQIYNRGNFVLTIDDKQSHIHANIEGKVLAFSISRVAADIVKHISDPKDRGEMIDTFLIPRTTREKFNGLEVSRELKPIFQKISPDDPIFFYVEKMGFRLSKSPSEAAAVIMPTVIAGMKGPQA